MRVAADADGDAGNPLRSGSGAIACGAMLLLPVAIGGPNCQRFARFPNRRSTVCQTVTAL
jgi:hypothetical protein